MAKKDEPAGDAMSKPDYGEKGQPQPTGINRTDSEGIDSATQPGAAMGEPADIAAARARVEAFDAQKERFADKEGRLPHVLKSHLDVRRGDQIYRVPAGSVITETDLTDDEWDHVLATGIAGEATLADLRAHEMREQQAENEQAARELRREQAGVTPKKARGEKPPKGASLVTDMSAEAAATANRLAAAHAAALTPIATRGAAQEK